MKSLLCHILTRPMIISCFQARRRASYSPSPVIGRTRSGAALVAAIALLAAAPAGATVVADWDLRAVLAHADAVIIGTVVAQRVFTTGEGLLTETDVAVERWLAPRNDPRARVTVTQLGGRTGHRGEGIVGDIHLRRGDRVLLMLERRYDGRAVIVGLVLGAYSAGDAPGRFVQQIGVPLLSPAGGLTAPPGLRTIDVGEVEALLAELPR